MKKENDGFFLACENFERVFDHSFLACFFFFIKWKLARVH